MNIFHAQSSVHKSRMLTNPLTEVSTVSGETTALPRRQRPAQASLLTLPLPGLLIPALRCLQTFLQKLTSKSAT